MDVLYAVAGAALIALVLVDALWTTLWVDGGAGPLTRRSTTWAWRVVLKAVGRTRHRALSLFGPAVLVATLTMWIVLLAAGWVLVFSAQTSALQSSSGEVAGLTGRVWYVAYTMFTVGNGDFLPEPGLWQIVSALVGVSGMVLVTLAISYLLAVVSAVVAKRAFAGQVTGLGATSGDLVLAGWNGTDLRGLDRQLAALSSQLGTLTQQYESYPVLQYYHAANEARSPIRAVAILDEALTMMCLGVPVEARPGRAALTSARSTVQSFLGTLRSALISPAPEPPEAPSLTPLRDEGVPTVGDDEFRRAVGELDERRKALLGVVRGDGWTWER